MKSGKTSHRDVANLVLVVVLTISVALFAIAVMIRTLIRTFRKTETESNKAQQETSDSAPSAESEAHEG